MIDESACAETFGKPTSAVPTRRVRRLLGRAATAICAVALVTVLATVILTRLPVFGYRVVIISGGSMEPAIDTGSLLLSQRVEPEGLQIGDVITFRYPESKTSITHRIVSVRDVDGVRSFTVKGDANQTADAEEISFGAGRAYTMLFAVPYAGYLLAFTRSPLGIIAIVGSSLAALAIIQLADGVKRRRSVHEAPSTNC